MGRLLLATVLAFLVSVAPARAGEVFAVDGAPAPGPARFDRVFVERFGPRTADRVLVLVPGFYGGAGDFALVGRDLVRRVPGLQVWAVDRRSQVVEDTSGFDGGDPDAALEYYLGGGGFRPVDGAELPFARRWGLEVALRDLRRVIARARRGGRSVVLGGHSLGASTAAAYAAWDFGGRPGHRGLDGLVLIDGGPSLLPARPEPRSRSSSPPCAPATRSRTCSASARPGRAESSPASAACTRASARTSGRRSTTRRSCPPPSGRPCR